MRFANSSVFENDMELMKGAKRTTVPGLVIDAHAVPSFRLGHVSPEITVR